MIKRLAPLALLTIAIAVAPTAQAHQCVYIEADYRLDLTLSDGTMVTITESGPLNALFFVQDMPTVACSDGIDSDGYDGALIISRGGVELCRNDNVDPSFDPFAFGGGIDTMGSEDACAATFSASSVEDPLLPDEGATTAAPLNSRVGLTRNVTSDQGSYRVGGDAQTIAEGTPGVSKRQVGYRIVAD